MPVRKAQAGSVHCSAPETSISQDGVAQDTGHSQAANGSPPAERSSLSLMPPASGTVPTSTPAVQQGAATVGGDPPSLQVSTRPLSPSQAASDQQGGDVSPVQLTELLSAGEAKSCWAPSDRNRNVTAFCLLPNPDTLAPSHSYRLAGERGGDVYGCTDPLAYGADAFNVADAYYSGDKVEVLSHGVVLASPQDGVYYKRSGHHHHHHQYPAQVCSNYSFSSAADDGRDYSPPDVNTFSQGDSANTPPLSDFQTTPLTASNASTGSPDSVQWSPDTSAATPAILSAYVPPASTASTGSSVLCDGPQDSRDFLSAQGCSAQAAYYSDEQSVEGDAMRDIQQDILRADIHRHIYENYHQDMVIYQPDEEDSADQAENLGPEDSAGHTKAAAGPKKRRRRTQTPVQRSAANMRERKRMCHLNVAFNSLKDRLPNVRNRKKLSRIQTLKAAIFYIGLLTECLQSS